MKKAILLIFIILLNTTLINAQKPGKGKHRRGRHGGPMGNLKGRVLDVKTNKPVKDAIITLIPFQFVTFSDSLGEFEISKVPCGEYTLEVKKMKYEVTRQANVSCRKDDTTRIIIHLIAGEQTEGDVYTIGTIQVSADKPIINQEPATTFKIESGEIEHMQANSLGDALELTPGILKKSSLGLSKSSTVSVRGLSSGSNASLESFGTQIMVNDIPLNNNAGMSTEGGYSGVSSHNAGSGLDLRMIPADNIEKIEVVQGIPSVKYGDLSEGLVKVETKNKVENTKFKVKYSEDTKEFSLTRGLKIKKTIINGAFNYAYSERDIRKEGDEWVRLSGNLTLSNEKKKNEKLKWKYSFIGTKYIDDEEPTDYLKQKTYNHGYMLAQNGKLEYKIHRYLETELSLFFTYRKEDLYKSKLVEGDPTSYLGEAWDKGNSYNVGGNWDFIHKRKTRRFFHKTLMGISFKYDVNRGEGRILHPDKNYYGQYSGKRSFSYDWFPGINQISFYFEDEITGKIWKGFNLNLGFRYDMFDKESLFKEANQGDFLSPRINFTYRLFKNFKLRAGYGKTAKSPSFDYLYKAPDLYSVADTVTSEVITYQIDESGPYLRAYYEDKIDLGFDYKMRKLASFRMTYYWAERNDYPISISYPIDYNENPNSNFGETYSQYYNLGKYEKQGLEAMLKTSTFYGINLLVSADYIKTKDHKEYETYYTSLQEDEPAWHRSSEPENKRLLMKYHIHYTSKDLGAWISASAQHYIWKKIKSNNLYPNPGSEWENDWFKYPSYWLWDITLTKSIIKSFSFSLYLRNIMDSDARYYHKHRDTYFTRASGISFGVQFSGYLNDFY